MRIYSLERTTKIPASLDKTWEFFSTPGNLNILTPDDLKFDILTDTSGLSMYPGMIINYKIQPFPLVKFRWTTEITHCVNKSFFVDEQRFGPYSFWHHQHHFEDHGDHVLMKDIVHYGLPFGPLGNIAQALFIKKKLEHIFNYRAEKIKEIF